VRIQGCVNVAVVDRRGRGARQEAEAEQDVVLELAVGDG